MGASLITTSADTFEKSFQLLGASYDNVIAGTCSRVVAGATYLYSYASNTTGSGDEIEYLNVPIASGTYTIRIFWASTNNSAGIAKMKIDGVDALNTDLYTAGTVNNVITDHAGISIVSGFHNIRIYCNTKNGASANYVFQPMLIKFIKTG